MCIAYALYECMCTDVHFFGIKLETNELADFSGIRHEVVLGKYPSSPTRIFFHFLLIFLSLFSYKKNLVKNGSDFDKTYPIYSPNKGKQNGKTKCPQNIRVQTSWGKMC